MNLEGKRIGFVMTGSFCTFRKTIDELKKIVKLGAKVVPIMSENSYTMDTKFGKAEDFINEIEDITGTKILHTIQEVEPLGPKDMLDILVVAPATGNTMAKLANDIIDGPATMAVKSHLRRERPVVIAVSTFIMGGFYHCIADSFYMFNSLKLEYITDCKWITSILGNFIGCNIWRLQRVAN